MQAQISQLYQQHSRKILATLIRLVGDFALAEEAMHDAFAIALTQWSSETLPENPVAWLVSTARFKAIDQLRRAARHNTTEAEYEAALASLLEETELFDAELIEDDQLRLVFICCHPVLAREAQLALTLREVCGITTEAIASAFLIKTTTVAQRIVRAKQKIRDENIPYSIPERKELPERLGAVLSVIYLLFNEGYNASSGTDVVRHELASEAIRLCRLLLSLLPQPEVQGLLALMLLQDARKEARMNVNGELIRLEDQDRRLWDKAKIAEGSGLVTRSLLSREFGVYTLQAAISAVHAQAGSFAATDWLQIVGLYDALLSMQDSPVVKLNRAVAVAMVQGPAAGLALVQQLQAGGELENYYLLYATLADFQRQLGARQAALVAYKRALALTQQLPERRFLESRIAQLLV